MKLSEHYENLAHEIKVLRKISKANKGEAGLPQFLEYGLLHLINMSCEDIDSFKKISEPQISNGSRLFGFYIIPRYTISLDTLIAE